MNIDTIKKYKNEFDHFVNGGKLLWARARDYKLSWLKATGNHQEFFNTNDEYYIYIIDDEYVEFRKALAEGETIQINNSNPETWIDIDTDKLANYNPSFLRIKPDEPKFKVGDFVRYIHSTPARALEINNINGNRYYFTNYEMSCLKHELEPWTPVKDEWCWFYDSKSSKYAIVSQFGGESNGRCFISITDMHWQFCEPFLNSIPSYLKDK